MDYISKNPAQTRQLAQKIAAGLHGGEVLCLYGQLGAGKTVFISGLINYFIPGKRVLSPTFIIVRHYHPASNKIANIYHVDLYRVSDETDIRGLGLVELLDQKKSIIAIEWAERLAKFLPKKRIDINIKIKDTTVRELQIKKWTK
jgi:tRNA threonylcarbamoyladenosine biosynthesis protein TsaE